MGAIVGIVVIFAMVFGGYIAAGGKMGIILKALPFELMMIGGSAVGAFIVSNDGHTIKHSLSDMGKVFGGAKWKKQDYNDLLCLMYQLIRLGQSKPLELEQHVENPSESSIFGQYPKIQKDKRAVDMICDTFRSGSMNFDDPHQVEDLLEKQLESDHHDSQHSSHAIQNMADALPALGHATPCGPRRISEARHAQPPTVLGGMIGGALVGTFLGVFLAYCMVQPISGRLAQIDEEDGALYNIIRDVFVAMVSDHPPSICVEIGRGNVPTRMQPDFYTVEAAQKELPAA